MIVLPGLASAQKVVTDPTAEALIWQEIGIKQQVLTEIKILAARRRITNDWIASPCGWTPFDGMQVTGWAVATVVRGHVVMRDWGVHGEPAGRLVRLG